MQKDTPDRLGRLKVHVINQKKSCTDGGNPTKKLHFWVTSHFKIQMGKACTEILTVANIKQYNKYSRRIIFSQFWNNEGKNTKRNV